MDTLAAGMQNLRIAQFFSGNRKPNTDDLARLRAGLSFIQRSLAAVMYLQEGQTEGLEPVALIEVRYTSSTVRTLHAATDFPSFRSYLQDLESLLNRMTTSREVPAEERSRIEQFFSVVGESMVSKALDGAVDEEG